MICTRVSKLLGILQADSREQYILGNYEESIKNFKKALHVIYK